MSRDAAALAFGATTVREWLSGSPYRRSAQSTRESATLSKMQVVSGK